MRALISVSDKNGIVPFCLKLKELGVELVSTGGTGLVLKNNGISFIPIEEITRTPEAFGGRMKTISFPVASALLFNRNIPKDVEEANLLGIQPIDLVVCNLYPFLETSKQSPSVEELIEMIDVGGPTMIRAAAKNFASVTCLTDPQDYELVMKELEQNKATTYETRKLLALKAFQLTASYDQTIQLELSKKWYGVTKPKLSAEQTKLRYGENPHQEADLFIFPMVNSTVTLANAPILQGKEISYNNYLDSDQAYKCVSELAHLLPHEKHIVIVKHGIPCGVATGKDIVSTLEKAWACDDISAFGGVISCSDTVDELSAKFIQEKFIEVLIAPNFTEEALKIFARKKNVRLIKLPLKIANNAKETMMRSINGGVLVQNEDEKNASSLEFMLKTQQNFKGIPHAEKLCLFGQTVIKYLKSNCLALITYDEKHFFIQASGVGQPNRLECLTKLIAPKIKDQNLSQSILFSDAFFPFRDSIDAAFSLGIKYIVEPGGSIKDQEVIDACNENKIALMMTGSRHFRH